MAADKYLLPLRSPQENADKGVSRAVVRAYEADELSINEIVSLGQNIYEAGVLGELPPRYFLLHRHLALNGLIHVAGRPFH